MLGKNIELKYLPELENGFLIAGFDGWGNALDISVGMINYIIRKLKAEPFGRINPDPFFRFDENRPQVNIADGSLVSIDQPGGKLYKTNQLITGKDIIILKSAEPNLNWSVFIDSILSLSRKMGVRTIITLGSMFDNILHTDRVISAVASTPELLESLKKIGAKTINYKGPGAIHSSIQHEAQKQGFECLSLWCHCPYYLQGTTHFGLLSHLGSFLANWCGFELDTEELEVTWRDLNKQIQEIIDKNPDLQNVIGDLRKSNPSLDPSHKQDKVVKLEDFLKPR
jgi:proteasome assembly chaperone (PAC2) family protein